MPTRREVLQAGAGIAASATLGGARFAAAGAAAGGGEPKSILILGGTGFIGPHLTQEALRLGWTVTHFNRGKREEQGVPGVETLLGDRKGKLDSLRDRKWDVVVDNTGYIPKYVRMSAELLAPNAGYCLFISSISAYADLSKPSDESSPTGTLDDPNTEQITDQTYGPMKALCEQYTQAAFKDRCAIVRPGYIVGPLDPTDRFTYWPVRAARGGEMLAPGTPRDPIQVVDVRDLTTWMMKLVEGRTTGIYNAISPPRQFTMGDIIAAGLKDAPRAHTRVTWVPEDFLGRQWDLTQVDLSPWAPRKGEFGGASLCATDRAVRAGLRTRPLQATVHDTMAWFHSLPPERQAKLRAGIDPEKEATALRAWHARA